MGSAVPSRVSLLISVLRLNLVLTYKIPPAFRGGIHLFIKTAICHRVSPDFIGSCNCVPMAFVHCRESAGIRSGPQCSRLHTSQQQRQSESLYCLLPRHESTAPLPTGSSNSNNNGIHSFYWYNSTVVAVVASTYTPRPTPATTERGHSRQILSKLPSHRKLLWSFTAYDGGLARHCAALGVAGCEPVVAACALFEEKSERI